MNICFLTKEVPNLRTGGIENVTYRLTQALRSRGHKVYWITMDSPQEDIEDIDGHLCIGSNGEFPDTVYRLIAENGINIVVNQAIDIRLQQLVEKLREVVNGIKLIKVLHTDPFYLIKGVRDQEPLYCEEGVFGRIKYKFLPTTWVRSYRRKKYLYDRYNKWIKTYDRIVLLSPNFIDDFKAIAGIGSTEIITSIPNPKDIAEDLSIEGKEKLVLFVGRLHSEAKRPDRLLEVWLKIYKKHPDWKLIFIGDGPMRESLERYCVRNNLHNVEFVGQTDPTKYYKIASISCITSTYEGFPLVCAEALSHGVIPVAFKSFGAVHDLIRDNVTGVLVSPYSIREYARKLGSLMNDEDERKSLQQNIVNDKEFANRFSMDTIVNKWEELFNELTK